MTAAPAQVPSRLSPVPPAKNGPPQVGVVARVGDVLAGDPDRVAVDGCGSVVAPASARRVADLRLVAREAVVLRGTEAAGTIVPRTDAGVARRWPRRPALGLVVSPVAGEGHHAASARRDADRRVGEVVAGRAEVALVARPSRVRIDDVLGDAGALLQPPSGLSAVSSAPHSLPFAYVTCCMRVSFESGRRDDLVVRRLRAEQQPPTTRPAMVDASSCR